ncbi:mycothiol synthase [[Pseudopropionibacterium] massiliense]|uniref:mycothiol synthase n=1 Tax=[Pseudopropionibacterium] massiliense TaxID=2220000 RepID=UPI001031128D|nr:mycothiol synthase [[Pseudopropionibacterium] massiliense]
MPELDPRVIAAACEARDGFSPLNDSALLVLERARKGEVLAHQDGFAILDDHDGTILVAVSPGARGKGLGTSLVAEAVRARPGHSVWAFRTLPAARAIAAKLGLRPVRELLRMGRPLPGITAVPAPPGYRILPFETADTEGVVEVNRVAFAHHPEQGRLTVDDFQALARQPWFDAAGLLVAHHDDEVVGFHWTKRHDATLGEVYVLAVHPDHGGAGLGRALLTAGLAHLCSVGCENVELYVEATEERVVALYAATGFRTLSVDTAYRTGGDTP